MTADIKNGLFLRPLPYLDIKWLRADLTHNLHSVDFTETLWNNLIQDCELVSSSANSVVNNQGHLSFLGDDGKHYCGAVKLQCHCCSGYCGPLSGCNCSSCHLLDSDSVIKKTLYNNQSAINEKSSELLLNSWLWGNAPNNIQKDKCLNSLVQEQYEIAIQAAENSLFSTYLKHQLYIYERYYVALSRSKVHSKVTLQQEQSIEKKTIPSYAEPNVNYLKNFENQKRAKDYERGTMGLAAVGTRTALNFSFAFLWRAWRSGEDAEMCSELLCEALESLQELPEASLFDTTQVSTLWIEVLERSIKFLRQVVIDDVTSGRNVVPRHDRHLALSLLLELGTQKGTLGSSLDAVVLLLKLWDKEKENNDNRNVSYDAGTAPLSKILKRYERINHTNSNLNEIGMPPTATATQSYLRFLTLPDQVSAHIDLKQAAVIIMAHLDRLATPHLPTRAISITEMDKQIDQRILCLGKFDSDFSNVISEPVALFKSEVFAFNYSSMVLKLKFKVKDVVISEEAMLFLSHDSKVYTSKMTGSTEDPILINEFNDFPIVKISTHFEGKHYLVLNANGRIYSWGTGENGRLGHGDTSGKEKPMKIDALKNEVVENIFCGTHNSAAITMKGELFTWGRGTNGHLGHGNSEDQLEPHLVKVLRGLRVIDVCLGNGDTPSLCVTDDGTVFLWGNGYYDKFDETSGSQIPIRVNNLPRIKNVYATSQCNLALSNDGKLYAWGRNLGFLDHGCTSNSQNPTDNFKTPKLIFGSDNKMIENIAIGLSNCLILTRNGEVYGWGRNDFQQICPQSISDEPFIQKPILVTPPSMYITGIACGAVQSILLYDTPVIGFPSNMPFVIDLCEHTFRLLDQLLELACRYDGRQTPSQESECITVSCLNLLRLQIYSVISNNYPLNLVGLSDGSNLLTSIKAKILKLAGESHILKTIQEAAQLTLQVGWCILLPTVAERAQTLTSLLSSDMGIAKAGHRFMIDLFVVSLMDGENLEKALAQTLNSERNSGNNLPLFHLIKQLLRNNSALTQVRLLNLISTGGNKNDNFKSSLEKSNPILNLLHRFQRILFSNIHQTKIDDITDGEILLIKYLENIVDLSVTSLKKAQETVIQGKNGITEIMKLDISDTLLYELLISLVLLVRDKPNILSTFKWKKTFMPLLQALDNLNRLMRDIEIQDSNDLAWPGIICRGSQKNTAFAEETQLIRKDDIYNQIVDGGRWIILNGNVCDIEMYKHENTLINEILTYGIGKDITTELNTQGNYLFTDYLIKNFKIGTYGLHALEEKGQSTQKEILTHFNSERVLAYLLGSRACVLQCGPELQSDEVHCKNYSSLQIFSGGLQVLQPTNPFDEEKGEARSRSSTTDNTPTESSYQDFISKTYNKPKKETSCVISQRIDGFLNALGEARLTDPLVAAWIQLCERFNRDNNLIWYQEFNSDHPIQELDRMLSAVLIHHQGIGTQVLALLDKELNSISEKPAKKISDTIRLVHQTKWTVIRTRQQLNRSYKEVCASIIDRLKFLLYEVRPAISLEQNALKKLSILHRESRFKRLVKKLIVEMKTVKKIQQHKNIVYSNHSQENLCRNFSRDNLSNFSYTSIIQEIKNLSHENLSEADSCELESLNSKNTLKSQIDDARISDKIKVNDQINDAMTKIIERPFDANNTNEDISLIKQQIVHFILQDTCDVETLRRAMFCQVQRYKIRRQGIEMLVELLQVKGLLDTVKYSIFCGYLGLHSKNAKNITKNVLNELNMITAYQKAKLIICQSKIIDWSVTELQKLVNQERIPSEQNVNDEKNNSNLGTYVFLKKLPRARFLLSIFGFLAKLVGPNEVSLIINSGIIGMIFGLLKQTGVDIGSTKKGNELSVVYGDTITKNISSKVNISGPDLSKLMKIGTRVCRGADWKWGDQDGNPPGEGRIISEVGEDGWVRVEWDTGGMNSYRMGKEKQYDLRLAESALNVISPETETDDDGFIIDLKLTGESHPKKLLRYCCSKIIKLLSISLGRYSDQIENNAILSATSTYRSILEAKTDHIINLCGFNCWTTLGFLRAISAHSKELCKYLSNVNWIELFFNFLNMPIGNEQDVFKKVQCIKLLHTLLINWDSENASRCSQLIKQLFLILGNITLHCPNDLSLIQSSNNAKNRIILSCSHSSTIAEEIIAMIRKLHTLPLWNTVINSFMSQKICVAADIYSGELCGLDRNKLEIESVSVIGVLNTIGGCDVRPRLGLKITAEDQISNICGFSTKGKCLLSTEQDNLPDISSEFKKISLNKAYEYANYSSFSLYKLPLNEILLNAFAVLMYGPIDSKQTVTGMIDVIVLRSQQLHLSILNSNCIFYRHQSSLRKILNQSSPRLSLYFSVDNVEDEEPSHQNKFNATENYDKMHSTEKNNMKYEENQQTVLDTSIPDNELLIHAILRRATQPSPIKACYSYQELSIAALNISQVLSSHIHTKINVSTSNSESLQKAETSQISVYNKFFENDKLKTKTLVPDKISQSTILNNRSNDITNNTLISQIMEIGFSKKSVELAMKTLTKNSANNPSLEQIVQWMLEHPHLCYPLPSTSSHSNERENVIESLISHDNESVSENQNLSDKNDISVPSQYENSDNESTTSDIQDKSSTKNQFSINKKFLTSEDFSSADQYAVYVRSLIVPGMIVKCCQNFEEIVKGDIGTVVKVDTEGLHDLNVQVDWQLHGSTYWVCFVHLNILESSKEKEIVVGSQVRVKSSVNIPRYKWGLVKRGSVGTVISISGKDCTMNFKQQKDWQGYLEEMELVNLGQENESGFEITATNPNEVISDWSRCIRTLTVSSNEISSINLLEKNTGYWQSSSNQGGKHWIRLEMNDDILIQNLYLTVDPNDSSYMPSLIVTKIGDSLNELKEYSWISVKSDDVVVPLLSDVREYCRFVEIIIKQCHNNGLQCRIHDINITGQKKQSDLNIMLMKADFLANEIGSFCESNNSNTMLEKMQVESISTVMVWGLNDKEQLGGLKGSKVKIPTFSQTLSRLHPIYISGGSKSLFIVSQDGKVYACGEGTNGRLGLGHNCNVSVPKQVPVLHQYVVKKVAVHSGGKHALALTLDGKVFSWGEGEDGKLGHGNRLTLNKPKLIESLRSKKIRDIACGSSHSAAITSCGELFTWGLGEYGRLGHGDNITQLKPKLVSHLCGKRIVQVACGSRDAQTLALTDEGIVYSWGDGDFGKLGRGGSEGSAIPHEIERLSGIHVTQIECGAQFSLALTKCGEVWTWGKGDYYRLGHGSDQHVRKPAPIQGLRGKNVVHVAVGALHCLAVTDTGKVYAWGDNDHGQQGSGNTIVNKKPALVIGLDSVHVNRVACGSSHSVAWGMPQISSDEDKKIPVPFTSTKDPLGGSGLGIYDSELLFTGISKSNKLLLSEALLSLPTYGAQQTALNYVIEAMSILQARQLIISALISHSQVIGSEKETQRNEICDIWKQTNKNTHFVTTLNLNDEIIAQGGGEAPADANDQIIEESDHDVFTSQSGAKSAFQSMAGSLSFSGSFSSNGANRQSKISASAVSVMAATIAHQEEMVSGSNLTGLDDFTSLLGESEAKSLIDLLKLSVAGRAGSQISSETISRTLTALGSNSPSIRAMLIETCIAELEDLCTSRYYIGKMPKPVIQESSHPYIDDITLVGHVKISGAEALRLEFDCQCSTEKRNDPLVIMDSSGRVIATRSGREFAQWAPEIRIQGDEMRWKFTSDSSVNGWGWRFWVHAIMPSSFSLELESDRAILCQPSMPLVMALLDSPIEVSSQNVLLRLAFALSACAQLNSLPIAQRIWSLKKLHKVITSKQAPKVTDSSYNVILGPLIPELLRQYEYEEPQVRGGIHLMHSEYFKTLTAIACDMQLDSVLPQTELPKWAWFRRYCSAVRVAQAFIRRTELPSSFVLEVRKKISEIVPNKLFLSSNDTTSMHSTLDYQATKVTKNLTPQTPHSQASGTSLSKTKSNDSCHDSININPSPDNLELATSNITNFLHEDHIVFKREHDNQLLQWLNQRPEDWALSWGGASTIYGWGHNHRGQLGGLEGSRIKIPTSCEALSLLRPVQLAGGEQTLYAVTPDGKLFATGYGAGGRLGIGGTESVTTPTLVESLQHVFIKKVAVNSGGKHCLALTTDGEVYAWGEGEDGKTGHGNRISYDRPKLIEALSDVEVVDIACGSAHSACITSSGHVLTWGKGRYGRLGHGDSEDQLRPKLIEALLGYRAIDIACGSGDAQTLCITDDDNVWSWGDGDYGKLGRGGSDGCKIPIKIESLSGLGVIKVECGSQFSVALTRSGAVYTWGKGDYHRLGHGTVDHVRRPKKVATLQGKKIISIATGSLHCVVCTESGEVYTWGDNDEGQLGDGTVSAIQRPRLVNALQGKHIVKVTCGSAHTLALSTYQLNEETRPPPSPPLEYDLVRDFPPETLHSRLVLLHHFSELICPYLSMLPIFGELSLSALKDILVYSIKEASFRKVIQTTMVRDKQHGPVIELNRIQVKRSRNKSSGGLAGIDGMKSVFGQMVQKLPLLTQEALFLPHRIWKVKFVGESVDDCGGGYSESIAEMCDELQNGSVPLLISTPNGRGEAGANRDCFLLDPSLNSILQMNMFRFLGVLMGIAIRTGSPLSLNLAEPVWRQLTGENILAADLTEVDRDYVAGLIYIRDMEDEILKTLDLPFSTSSAKGYEVNLSTRFAYITPQNRQEYVRLALNYRLHEFDEQVKAIRDGMSKVIPVPLLSLFSASELQAMVCGSPDIPLSLLKSVANYKGVDSNSPLVIWFWEVMEEFTNQERSLFLRFVWGRTRLPRTIADFRGRDFVLQVLDKYNPPDHFLPESYTCFFLLKMPRYSCKSVLSEKLKYAIHFCKSIDTDEYARVAMGDPTEATGSEDNSDFESVTSHDA